MKVKNVISFLLVVVLIVACACIAAFDVKIGSLRVPSTFDEERGIKKGLDLVGGSIIVFEPDVKDLSKVSEDAMDSAESIIRTRLDAVVDTEATITRQDDTSIRIEIPGEQNPHDAVEKLGKVAKLEFRDADGKVVMDGSKKYVKSAGAKYGPTSEYSGSVHYIQLNLTDEGRKSFKVATQNAINAGAGKDYIAIVLDDAVQMQPQVNEVIDDDSCIITGNYTAESAQHYADLINSGSLPFNLRVAELNNIGPTLGSTALNTSLTAALIGILLVMIFMLAIYRLPGLVACVSLIAYTAITTLIMAGFYQPEWRFVTLTLPGIAGVILSIGMAVDANVVIFERIKDELHNGKSVGAAVNSGFKRALTAVVDSNITTIIAAVVLYFFGTGTVKGFAITLFIGIVLSMFTAVTLTKFLLKRLVAIGVKNPWLYGLSKKRRGE